MNDSHNYFLFFILLHLILFIFTKLFKNVSVRLSRTGITIQFLQIKWFTTIFNHYLQRIGIKGQKFQKTWFTAGVWVTVFSLPLAIFLMIQSTYILFHNLVWKEIRSQQTLIFLEPAVPGLNIPISDLGYYVITLLICSIFHELGHASAASREGLHITGVGFVLMFVIPVTYVQIKGLENLSLVKQLRIICAGVWHNIILLSVSWVLLLLLPFLTIPFYEYGNGIQVTSIHKNSPLGEVGGLNINDVIIKINKCNIVNYQSWIECINEIRKNSVLGFCLSTEFINENDESIPVKQLSNTISCCRNETLSKLCFEYLDKKGNPLELPQFSCLKVRTVIEHSKNDCYSSDDCLGSYCFRPSLSNGTKLIEIEGKDRLSVLFLGHPSEILIDVHVSDYIRKSYFSTSIPNSITKLLIFLIMFSGAFIILNLLPCFYFDGQHIIHVLVYISLSNNVRSKKSRRAISNFLIIIGSLILLIYIILMFFTILQNL